MSDYSFGNLLRSFRVRNGISQTKLAATTSISRRSLQYWENEGISPKDGARVMELARALNLNSQETDQLLQAASLPLTLGAVSNGVAAHISDDANQASKDAFPDLQEPIDSEFIRQKEKQINELNGQSKVFLSYSRKEMSATEPGEGIKLFLCYAREDEQHVEELRRHLRGLKRQGLITFWYDRNIAPGEEWEHQIDTHLNEAQIILLLVSSYFIDSDYCYGIEMKKALERHERGEATVIPIILRHVYWQGTPFGKLQALPQDAKPIISNFWHNPDEACFNTAEGIRSIVEKRIEEERIRKEEALEWLLFKMTYEDENNYTRQAINERQELLQTQQQTLKDLIEKFFDTATEEIAKQIDKKQITIEEQRNAMTIIEQTIHIEQDEQWNKTQEAIERIKQATEKGIWRTQEKQPQTLNNSMVAQPPQPGVPLLSPHTWISQAPIPIKETQALIQGALQVPQQSSTNQTTKERQDKINQVIQALEQPRAIWYSAGVINTMTQIPTEEIEEIIRELGDKIEHFEIQKGEIKTLIYAIKARTQEEGNFQQVYFD